MAIENMEQLKIYIDELPWYKKIFFPRILQARLSEPSMSEQEIREVCYSQVRSSWLWRVYDWLFPELMGFSQQSTITIQQISLISRHEEDAYPLPENYENDLLNSIRCEDQERFVRLVGFLSTHRVEYGTLMRVLRVSLRHFYGTYTLLGEKAYSPSIVSGIFVDAVRNTDGDWWDVDVIHRFTSEKLLNERLNFASINEV